MTHDSTEWTGDPSLPRPGESNGDYVLRLERDHPEVWQAFNLGPQHPELTGRERAEDARFGAIWDAAVPHTWKIGNSVLIDRRAMVEVVSTNLRHTRERASRAYDIAPTHLGLNLPVVTMFMGWLDYGRFLDAQDGADDPGGILPVIQSAIDQPGAEPLRRRLAHEILRRAWADNAARFAYYGDGDPRNDTILVDVVSSGVQEEVRVRGEMFTRELEETVALLVRWSEGYHPGVDPAWTPGKDMAVRRARNLAVGYVERRTFQDIWDAFTLDGDDPQAPASHFHPAIRGDFGTVPSDGVAWNATTVQYAGPHGWARDQRDGMPTVIIPFHKGKQESRHSFSRELITVEEAERVVERLNDRHADIFEYVHAKWLANRDEVANGAAIPIDAAEILASWNVKQHSKGGYEPKQIDEVASIIADLELQTVEARVIAYGPKGKEDEYIRETRLILVEQSDYRLTLNGERRYFRWSIRPGAWAVRTFELTEEHKQVHRAIFALEAQAYYAKRIGRYLEQQWRINCETGAESPPMVVNTLLRGARIELPQANHLRFRRRVEEQIRELQSIGAITSWSYPEGEITQGGAKGHARWLDSTIVFGVPEHVRATYRELAKKRRGRRPRNATASISARVS